MHPLSPSFLFPLSIHPSTRLCTNPHACRCVAGSANSIGLQVVSDTVKFSAPSSSGSSAALPPAPGTKAAADKAKALAAAKAKEGAKAKAAPAEKKK